MNEDIRRKLSEDNFSNVNTITYTKANTISNNNIIVKNNIEENKNEINIEEDENKFLSLIHLFLKNFEANHITTEILENKMKSIFESFKGKSETTKEDFILPFYNLFIESMKVSQESDKQIIHSFFDDYIDYLKGNTNEFFGELIEIFENLIDYTPLENNEQLLSALTFSLQNYKTNLEDKLKEFDKEGTYLITFDIFRKILNDLNISLNDDLMEFLLYKMKSSVKMENHSIFDLNYNIILELLNKIIKIEEDEKIIEKANENNEEEDEKYCDNLSNQISEKLSEFKNNMIKENTDLEKACKDKVKTIINDENNFEVIEKDDFFDIMEKYGVIVNEEIKENIYKLFLNDAPICTNKGAIMMMDFKKLNKLFLNDYYSEENK